MRRTPATLLLAVFSFWLLAPFVSADADASLPGCCRRDGKHHCAAMGTAPAAPGFQAARQRCPRYPSGSAVPAHAHTLLLKNTRTIFTALPRRAAAPAPTAAQYRTGFSRSRQKRGPPFLIS